MERATSSAAHLLAILVSCAVLGAVMFLFRLVIFAHLPKGQRPHIPSWLAKACLGLLIVAGTGALGATLGGRIDEEGINVTVLVFIPLLWLPVFLLGLVPPRSTSITKRSVVISVALGVAAGTVALFFISRRH